MIAQLPLQPPILSTNNENAINNAPDINNYNAHLTDSDNRSGFEINLQGDILRHMGVDSLHLQAGIDTQIRHENNQINTQNPNFSASQQPQNLTNVQLQQASESVRNIRPYIAFDPLLGCHSHHGTRVLQRRPQNLVTYLSNEVSQMGQVAVNYKSNADFLEDIFDILRCSTCIDAIHPILKELIQNYLLRGR